MSAGLAIGASVFYGSADFLGGLAARRSPVVPVVATSMAAGVLVLLIVLPFAPVEIAWGAGAGGIDAVVRGARSPPRALGKASADRWH